MIEPFPLVDVAGGPHERGVAYGSQARARIQKSAALYRRRLERLGIGKDHAAALIRRYLPEMEDFGAQYVEEMRGIAEGCGLSLDDIVLINARTEIVALARRKDPVVDGCTSAAVLPPRASGSEVLHAVNWDWLAECVETAIVLRVRRNDGPDILTFTEAGGLARSGLNAAGIAITANYLESDRDYRQSGVPLPLIRRKVLEQEHIALAISAVATTPKACSNNMMLSHADGFAIDFECAPDEAFALYPENDLLVHANHWVSPAALSKLKDTGIPEVPDSFYRDWRVKRQLGSKVEINDLKAALFDDFGTPYAVCRPVADEGGGNLGATVAMIVMQPGQGVMEVCPMPAMQQVFTQYAL
jgi:hypothetical protein